MACTYVCFVSLKQYSKAVLTLQSLSFDFWWHCGQCTLKCTAYSQNLLLDAIYISLPFHFTYFCSKMEFKTGLGNSDPKMSNAQIVTKNRRKYYSTLEGLSFD